MSGSLMAGINERCLLISVILVTVGANVIVKSSNSSKDVTYIYDRAAAFGPSIPDKGILGYVFSVIPRNACRPVDPPPNDTGPWIALIERDNCSFVEKIRNVQRWFTAAIVFNHPDDNKLETMHGDGEGVTIPSVFVGWSDGMMLVTNYCYNCTTIEQRKGAYKIEIDDEEPSFIISPLFFVMFASVVGICITSMIVFLIVKWCRDFRKRRRARLSIRHLKKIPTKKFKKGDDYDVCAICLDDYEEGDKLRLLPCSHAYHMKCIDPWLTKNKRCCPVCKRKVIPGDDPSSETDSSDDDDGPSERTPLLASTASGSGNRRSTFDNSGLPPAQPAQVSHVNEGDGDSSDDDTDQSDSELGAVGGISHVNLAQENPLLSLPGKGPAGQLANQERLEASVNHSTESCAVVESNLGEDNPGLAVDDESSTSSEEDSGCSHDDEVVFSERKNKKEEKKTNGVV